ncbi:hypothetical protein BP5796_08652 [Coleophoma crateriformis]|uniref:Mitochondrial import inner membrane translocase subunit TIM50 n=1 Tax=Coleophoma crateriformis TaxID=565419 RepID=A0A3D8R879_9HELO|nr:hypothetical protein BP5796_08652 [Coleophoma crateriformis]
MESTIPESPFPKPRSKKKAIAAAQRTLTTSQASASSVNDKGHILNGGAPVFSPASTATTSTSPGVAKLEASVHGLSKTKMKAVAKAYRAAEREMKAAEKAGLSRPALDLTSVEEMITKSTTTELPIRKVPDKKKKDPKNAPQNSTTKKQVAVSKIALPWNGRRGERIVPPSEQSGGVPEPTLAYLNAARRAPEPSINPRYIMVIIDLNGTILHRPSRNPTKFIERPNARRFLKYCVDTFTVVIWSSAREENVESMCKAFLTGELKDRVLACWGRDKFDLTPADYNARVQCYKRLTKLWNHEDIMRSHPNFKSGGRWDQTNTVLIDDSMEKARSEPFNLVQLPEFSGNENELGNILPQVHDYINWLSCHNDVSSCIKAKPFKAQ